MRFPRRAPSHSQSIRLLQGSPDETSPQMRYLTHFAPYYATCHFVHQIFFAECLAG